MGESLPLGPIVTFTSTSETCRAWRTQPRAIISHLLSVSGTEFGTGTTTQRPVTQTKPKKLKQTCVPLPFKLRVERIEIDIFGGLKFFLPHHSAISRQCAKVTSCQTREPLINQYGGEIRKNKYCRFDGLGGALNGCDFTEREVETETGSQNLLTIVQPG